MKRTPIQPELSLFPAALRPLAERFPIFDSSCSRAARVFYLDGDGGLFLKSAPAGSLKIEADMTRYFHGKGLAPEVLAYLPESRDWLLTKSLPGSDCTSPEYRSDPQRLCDTLAAILRQLHETPFDRCPVPDRCGSYRATVQKNHLAGHFDQALLHGAWEWSSPEEAWQVVQANGSYLRNDTLLHGDYCLPNILLENWRLSGLIDLDGSGVGDRHIDLFWGIWTLAYNLKTNAYQNRFLDAYGRERVEPEMLRTVAAFEVFG